MSRRRIAWVTLGSVAGLLVLALGSAVLILRSAWFEGQVRARIVSTVEMATGGRAEIGTFRFDWRQMRAEVDRFVLHGTEPRDRPPLLRASSIAVGLKIISVLRRDVDIEYLGVEAPRIYLIVYPDGRTNVPEPRIQTSKRDPVDALLSLAVGRFDIHSGVFEMEARSRTPFDASGRNLYANFRYERATPRYLGEIAVNPLNVKWQGSPELPLGVQFQIALERNRIGIPSARVTTANSSIDFSGTLESLASPRASFRYQASAAVVDLARTLREPNLGRGSVQMEGDATWAGSSDYSLTGNFRAAGIDFRQDPVRFRNLRATGAVRADARGVNGSGVRFAGEAADGGDWFPVEGTVQRADLLGRDARLRGVSLALLGGSFQGDAALPSLSRFQVSGSIDGFQARRVVAVYNRRQRLPWDSVISGPITLEGSLRQRRDFHAMAHLTLAPAAGSPAVSGDVNATFDGLAGTLDLGTSVLNLPSSRAVVSGAIGRHMRVHLESRDLDDFLPAFGESSVELPVKLDRGALLFDGEVNGKPEDPQIAGRLAISRFAYGGNAFDSFQGAVAASPESVRIDNAALTRGSVRAEFQGSLGLKNWKPDGHSAITAAGRVRNAPLRELAGFFKQADLGASGTVSASGQVTGSLGNPQASADLEIAKGALDGEPFDRVAAHVTYQMHTVQLSAGQVAAGAKQVRFSGTYDHASDNLRTGRLRFQTQSNAIPLDQVETLRQKHSGIAGTVQFTASGAVDLTPAGYRLINLEGDIAGHGLQITGLLFGEAHLTAHSEGTDLRVSLDSDVVDSMLKGQGEWRLEGDYPGSAQVTFSQLDLAQMRAWLAPGQTGTITDFRGVAQGELQIQGPLLKPQQLTAELRLPTLSLGPAPTAAVHTPAESLTLRNDGPVVATYANSVVTIQKARLVGRFTDLTVGGRVALDQKSPLDVRVNGQADLALLHDYDHEITSSGRLNVDAGMRGTFRSPQFTGRVEVHDAAFSYADLPNGLANANGQISFAGDRATIQNLSGETGGGKVQISGFTAYGGGNPIFGLHAEAQGVRVRYPEGVSTVANASLNLTGTAQRSMMLGTITILRSAFNVQSDFSSLLVKSAEPVQTPSVQPGFLGGLNFDVTIETAPDIQFESSLAQGIAADASLRLRGTPSNPALLGRIHISQGQLLFFGTKYNIDQGSISFYNPARIEPIVDIDLETRARGIDITLAVTGPLNRLNLTPRSDPPLQFSEIVALLATGESPSTDPNVLAMQTVTPQPFQQSASALLGQVISSPVSGRLQRFFGISKVRIDPTLPGVTNNPLARLTLEQQVTPDVTFTYITNVSNANPQVVSVEWAVSKKFSVIALREENGMFGLDFFYKRVFR